MTGRIGVAISTTGDKHRMRLLQQSVRAWDKVLPLGSSMFITVDGSVEDAERVRESVDCWTGAVFRVGQPEGPERERLGVAANKNTGLELLMGNTSVDHLFLCDDDTWPLSRAALDLHIEMNVMHTMVCWGKHRLVTPSAHHRAAYWNWPRGVLLYLARQVVTRIGGMDERFGPGGHEHVEYSQRIYSAGMSPAPFTTPAAYANHSLSGDAMGAANYWHAEDMRRPGEPLGNHRLRRRNLTSVRRTDEDWPAINKIMAEREGNVDFVPYRASLNGRASATLCESNPSQGAGQA